MEEVVFKVGDVVHMRKLLPNGEENRKFNSNIGKIFTVNGLYHDRVSVLDEGGRVLLFYTWRLKIVNQEPEGLVKGDYVICTSDKFKSVTQGNIYLIQSIVDGRVKLKGISNTLPLLSFVAYEGEPIVEDVGNELLKELAAKVGDDPGVCSYAIITKEGKKIWNIRDICHARITCDVKEVTHVALNFSGHYKGYDDQTKEDYKVFLNYIVNDSPLKECFISRPVDDMVKDGVLINVDKTPSEVFTAAIATRHFTEFLKKRALFSKIMDIGFDGNTAMFVSTFFDEKDGLLFNNFPGSHHFLASSQKSEELFKFFKEGIKDEKGTPYRTNPNNFKSVLSTVSSLDIYGKTDVKSFIKKIKGIEECEEGWGFVTYKMKGDKSLVKVCAKICSLVN